MSHKLSPLILEEGRQAPFWADAALERQRTDEQWSPAVPKCIYTIPIFHEPQQSEALSTVHYENLFSELFSIILENIPFSVFGECLVRREQESYSRASIIYGF